MLRFQSALARLTPAGQLQLLYFMLQLAARRGLTAMENRIFLWLGGEVEEQARLIA